MTSDRIAFYVVIALVVSILLWRITREKSTERKNGLRRTFVATIGGLCWPATIIVGLLYSTTSGRKLVNLIIFGRTESHDSSQ